MLNGTKVQLTVNSPERDQAITKPATATISADKIEFNKSKFYELNGSIYNVVPTQCDVSGSRFSYKVNSGYSGAFTKVPDKGSGFNGYGLKFDALGSGKRSRSTQSTLSQRIRLWRLQGKRTFHEECALFER
jgi:hypothetical protein